MACCQPHPMATAGIEVQRTPAAAGAAGISDAELVSAWRSGDEAAAAVLVSRHAAAVGRYLVASGALISDLDDLVQETMCRAFLRIDAWRGTSGLRPWLLAIAVNVFRDQLRRTRGRLLIALDDAEVAATATPATELAEGEAADALRSALRRLPRLQREVFLLRALEGLDYREIASALGTTPGAARVHYHAASRRLKEVLK